MCNSINLLLTRVPRVLGGLIASVVLPSGSFEIFDKIERIRQRYVALPRPIKARYYCKFIQPFWEIRKKSIQCKNNRKNEVSDTFNLFNLRLQHLKLCESSKCLSVIHCKFNVTKVRVWKNDLWVSNPIVRYATSGLKNRWYSFFKRWSIILSTRRSTLKSCWRYRQYPRCSAMMKSSIIISKFPRRFTQIL